MDTLLISVVVFLSVYTGVYYFYLYKKPGSQFIENTLHKLLKPFGFLASFKVSRSFAGRSIPAKLAMAGSPISIVEFILFKILSLVLFPLTAYIIFQNTEVIYIVLPILIGFAVPDI